MSGPGVELSLGCGSCRLPDCSCDLDDVCAYQTTKHVRVRHRSLGCVYYFAMFCIFLYTVGWTILFEEGYVQPVPFAGAVRATIKPPDPNDVSDNITYCAPFGRVPGTGFADQLPCIYPDVGGGILSKITPGADSALFISTRVTKTVQRRTQCDEFNFTCAPWEEDDARTAYVGGLENCTITLQNVVSNSTQGAYSGTTIGHDHDHETFIQDSFDGTRAFATMRGSVSGRTITVRHGPAGDLVSVGELIFVAGLDLDENLLDYSHDPPTLSSLRYKGVTINVRVSYTGDKTAGFLGLGTPQATYEYVVEANDMEAKQSLLLEAGVGTNSSREKWQLSGLQLLLTQEATLLVFDLPTLFLSILSGMALLGAAKYVADFFLLNLAPRRHDYRLFVERVTPDFSPDTDAERKLLNKVLEKKRLMRCRRLDPDSHAPDLTSSRLSFRPNTNSSFGEDGQYTTNGGHRDPLLYVHSQA